MTPEERARQIADRFELSRTGALARAVASAIQEAVLEEREACARSVEHNGETLAEVCHPHSGTARESREAYAILAAEGLARLAAACIRKRGAAATERDFTSETRRHGEGTGTQKDIRRNTDRERTHLGADSSGRSRPAALNSQPNIGRTGHGALWPAREEPCGPTGSSGKGQTCSAQPEVAGL
jgi:hypothetical protein